MNFNKNQIWSSFDHWVTRTIRPKLINLKSSMIKKSKIRFALHFSSWPLESHSFGLKYGHYRYHQLQKCPNSKNYFVKAQFWNWPNSETVSILRMSQFKNRMVTWPNLTSFLTEILHHWLLLSNMKLWLESWMTRD